MKNREEIEKEFEEKIVHNPDGTRHNCMSLDEEKVLKSHISKIRQDDMDGLVEWAEQEIWAYHTMGDDKRQTFTLDEVNELCLRSHNQALSDIIAHLTVLKEKV
jgi:hypothetical protein